jgi:hypothetical protein
LVNRAPDSRFNRNQIRRMKIVLFFLLCRTKVATL